MTHSSKNLKTGEIVLLDHLRLNRNREKDCTCMPPRYEIDLNNRRVQCLECQAILDPFEAIARQAIHVEDKNRIQQERYEQSKLFQERAEYFERRYHELLNKIHKLEVK